MKRLLCALCALLFLAGCAPVTPDPSEDTLTITATTYPVYLLALSVTREIPGVRVERLDTGSVSCLHDYTLSVRDMKKIERADVLTISGAGLEDFMSDALAATNAHVIDCSVEVDLLPAAGHHDHDHEHEHEHGHFDPHYWLDPVNMETMLETLRQGLCSLLPDHTAALSTNAELAQQQLRACAQQLLACGQSLTDIPGLITFHDGFQYFANVLGLPLLRSIEEEAGSEASAKEIVAITALIKERNIPVIFTEVNGSDATAQAIRRETGCQVAALSMLMDGREPTAHDPSPIAPYTEAILSNVDAILTGFSGTGGVHLT